MDEVERLAVGLAVARRIAADFDAEAALWLLRGTVPDSELAWAAARGLGLGEDCLVPHLRAEPDPARLADARDALRRAGFEV